VKWELAIIAAAVLAVAGGSARLTGTSVTPAMVFVAIGVLVGPLFAVIVVEEAKLPGADTILLATYLTIGLSVLAHGITAAPAAKSYARWYEAHGRDAADMERVPAGHHRVRTFR
jgi:hypothetical protein